MNALAIADDKRKMRSQTQGRRLGFGGGCCAPISCRFGSSNWPGNDASSGTFFSHAVRQGRHQRLAVTSSPRRAAVQIRRGWSGTPDDIAAFFTRIYAGLSPEQVAALLGTPSLQFLPCVGIDSSPAKPLIEPAHHVEVLSSLGHEQTDSERHLEPCSRNRGMRLPR